jgi:type II secretory pathway pseudopilin PulG
MGYPQARHQRFRYLTKFSASIALIFLIASSCAAQASPAGQSADIPGFQDLNKYPGLLAEFARLFEKLQHDVQFPAARSESHLLPLLPESTVMYAAFPNYGETEHQALNIFRQELQESPVLRDWWQHGQVATTGPKVLESLENLYQLSQYLGDEIVISGATDGRNAGGLIVAEVRKPGLKKLLEQRLSELAGKSKLAVHILDQQELATAEDNGAHKPVVLVRPDFVVVGTDLAAVRGFSARLDRGSREFVSIPFGQRVVQSYLGGATVLGAVDLQKILTLVPTSAKQEQMTLQRTGLGDVRYLVWDHKNVSGQAVSQTELSFTAPRHGVAAWLAPPSSLGSLDFASPKALMVAAMELTNPPQIFEDVKGLAGASNAGPFATIAQFEKLLNLSLKEDVLDLLGGEITLELDDVTPPKPVWKAMLQVNDPKRLRQTFTTLLAAGHLSAEQVDDGGVTYYTVQIPAAQTPFEIGYAFVDGYLIMASSRETVAEAVRLHRNGESLDKSKKFLAALPPGHPSGASALLYQDPIAMTALNLKQAEPQLAPIIAQLVGKTTPAVVCAYGEETAIRGESTNALFDTSAVLVVAAIAIPNLLRARTAANEASAVGTIRTVNTAQITYAATYPQRGFAPDLATLGPDPRETKTASPDHAGFLEPTLGGASCTAGAWCVKSGFRFSVTGACSQHQCEEFVAVGTPVGSSTGGRSFCSTSDGVIRFNSGPPLTSPVTLSECRAWPPLQ